MQKISNIFYKAAILSVVAIMSVGCLLEKEDVLANTQNVMIELNVSSGEMTKAAPTANESAVNSLRIYAFYGNRLAGYLERGLIVEGDPFYMDLELPATGIHEIDFYVIANETQMSYQSAPLTLSKNMSREQLEEIRYTGLISGESLPMYAKQKESIDVDKVREAANAEEGHDGHFILIDPVELKLSRSLAKISLYAAKTQGAETTPQIIKATLLAAGTRQYSYLFEQDDEVLNNVISRPNDRDFLTSAVSVTKSVELNSSSSKDPDAFDVIFTNAYLPEVTYGSNDCSVSSGNSREVVMRVDYALGADGEVRTGYVYMPRINRNTHYKVCLLINPEGKIKINYEVAPWQTNTMEDFHFDYPTHSYLREQIPVTEADIAIKPTNPATMSETVPFTAYFQMTFPSNDAWTPTLEGPHAGNCEVKVYEIDDMVEIPISQSNWPIEASDKWYKLVVSPNQMKLTAGNEVRLAVTYQASGFDTIEYMLINGSHGEYYWPYSGTTTQDANYVIITMVN